MRFSVDRTRQINVFFEFDRSDVQALEEEYASLDASESETTRILLDVILRTAREEGLI